MQVTRAAVAVCGDADVLCTHRGHGVKVDYCCWKRHERGVESVEHAAVARQYVAAVFYAECALEERLYKVAPCAEEHYHQAETHPRGDGECVAALAAVGKVAYKGCNGEHKQSASDASFPTLAWADAWKEFVTA